MIYIMAHKSCETPKLPGYVPLQVGAALHDDLGFLRDDTGDNISARNPYFCELTGLYWVWKNCDDEVKGLVHYRRYFTRSSLTGSYDGILPFNELAALLDGADVLVPTLKYNHISSRAQLLHSGKVKARDLDELRECVKVRCPDYLPEFDAFYAGHTGHYMNILLMRRETYDAYCAWLFDLLFALAERLQALLSEGEPARLYGYLSEGLLNVYIAHNTLRVVERPVANLALTPYWRWRLFRRNYTNRLRYPLWKLRMELRKLREHRADTRAMD